MDTDLETKLVRNGAVRAPGAAAKEKRVMRWTARVVHRCGGQRTVFSAGAGAMATALWLGLFTIGMTIPTEPYRARLLAMDPVKAGAPSIMEIFESLIVVLFAYTPTNLVLLCCASALVGCLGRLATTDDAEARALIHRHHGDPLTPPASVPAPVDEKLGAAVSPLAPAITAITWGLFIYLVVVSGTVVVAGDPFKSTSPDQYLRLAGSSSLLAFAVGWRPQFVTQLVTSVCGSRFSSKS
jgi:hypothetical protein